MVLPPAHTDGTKWTKWGEKRESGKKSGRGMEEELGVSRDRSDQNTIYACIQFSIKIILKRRFQTLGSLCLRKSTK